MAFAGPLGKAAVEHHPVEMDTQAEDTAAGESSQVVGSDTIDSSHLMEQLVVVHCPTAHKDCGQGQAVRHCEAHMAADLSKAVQGAGAEAFQETGLLGVDSLHLVGVGHRATDGLPVKQRRIEMRAAGAYEVLERRVQVVMEAIGPDQAHAEDEVMVLEVELGKVSFVLNAVRALPGGEL